MKAAIYIDDGSMQVVLTPENKFEENVVSTIAEQDAALLVKQGQFYGCRGGWTRWSDTEYGLHQTDQKQSLIIVVSKKADA